MKPGLRVVRGRDWIINMNDPDGNGFGLTPLFGDRRGFMPPQLKKKKTDGNGPGTFLRQNLTQSHLWEVKWDKTDERCWHFMGTNSMGEKNIDLKSLTFLLLHLRKLSEVSSLWPRTPMT